MKLLVATNNEDKAREIFAVLCEELGDNAEAEVLTLAQAGLKSDPDENGKTFAENARIKAVATRDEIIEEKREDLYDYIIIADDSGICVDALNGEPGIHSARFAEGGQVDSPHANYSDNNEKMLAVMKDVPAEERGAQFVTAACVLIPETLVRKNAAREEEICDKLKSDNINYSSYQMEEVEGRLDGHIGTQLLGENGFGYDSLFYPVEYEGKLTNAQLTPKQKDAISHRGKAIRKVAKILREKMTL